VTQLERRLLVAAYVLLGLLTLAPIWLVRHHPLHDLGWHLAAVSTWNHYYDPAFPYQRYYKLALGPNPYWGYYYMLHVLSAPFGLEVANRLLLSLYALGIPGATLYLALRLGRSPWLGMFAFPVVWNYSFSYGFIPFAMGMPLVLLMLALFDRFCERPTWALGAIVAVGGSLTFYFHLLPWGMYVGAAGMLGLLHEGRSFRRMLARAAVWGSAFTVGVATILFGKGYHMGTVAGHLAFKHYPITMFLKETYDFIWGGCAGHEDEVLAAALLASWIALRATARRAPFRWHDLRAAGMFVVAYGAYLLLPRSVLAPVYWWGINIRFAAFAAIFLGLCIPGAIEGWRRWLLVPVALVGIGFSIDTLRHWRRADQFVDGFDQLGSIPTVNDRVLFASWPPVNDDSVTRAYVRPFAGRRVALYGGFLADHFDNGFPLVYRERYPTPEGNAPVFRWDIHAPYYDYFLTFNAPRDLFRGHEKEMKLVGQVKRWALWKFPGPRSDVPPHAPYPNNWVFDPRWKP
jgi:hypothetical protein